MTDGAASSLTTARENDNLIRSPGQLKLPSAGFTIFPHIVAIVHTYPYVDLSLLSYRRTRGIGLTGLSPFCEKNVSTYNEYFYVLFLFYSYVKSCLLDNDSCLPKRFRRYAILHVSVRNSIFPFFVMVITCCGPSCGLWLCVSGWPKIFRKLL